MEITDDIKEKVFGQYLGCDIFWQDITGKLTAYNLHGASRKIEVSKLILKSIHNISKEDAKGMFKAIGYGFKSHKFILEILQALPFNEAITAYQYLISKGYDMPNYLLYGKTLFDCGLAIYEKH